MGGGRGGVSKSEVKSLIVEGYAHLKWLLHLVTRLLCGGCENRANIERLSHYKTYTDDKNNMLI